MCILTKQHKQFSCFHCNYFSKKKFNLRRHISAWHVSSKSNPPGNEFRCVLCGLFSSSRREVVYSHYQEIHDIVIRPPVCHNFSDWEEFLAWKAAIEIQEVCDFIKFNSTKTKQSTTYYYRCHRDGYYRPRGKGVRRLKVKGSNKINGCCPASLSVRKSVDGKIQVKFSSTHVGHKQEFIDFHRGKITSKGRALRKRHERSLKLDMIVLRTQEGWDLWSKTPTPSLYSVKKTSKFGCCGCELKCIECSVCIHEFVCTCIDNSIKWNLCMHIHYVCQNNIEHPPVAVSVVDINSNHLQIMGDLVMDVPENERINDEQQVLLRELSRPKPTEDLEKKKAMALSMFQEAFSLCSEPSHFECLIDRLKPIKPVIRSLIQCSHGGARDFYE